MNSTRRGGRRGMRDREGTWVKDRRDLEYEDLAKDRLLEDTAK